MLEFNHIPWWERMGGALLDTFIPLFVAIVLWSLIRFCFSSTKKKGDKDNQSKDNQ